MKIILALFIAVALTPFYGCVTNKSQENDNLVTTAELDSRTNSKKLEELTDKVNELTDSVKDFQEDIRYLREDLDKAKRKAGGIKGANRSRESTTGRYKEGSIVTKIPPSIEKVQGENPDRLSGDTSTNKDVNVSSLTPKDYYQGAYDDLRFGEYESSIKNFTQFIEQFPDDSLADNAQYWIGENYYALKDFKKAEVEFKKVYENYPDGNKAQDARLKHALCLYELKEKDRCFSELEELASEYSGSRIGEVALQQIKRLKMKEK